MLYMLIRKQNMRRKRKVNKTRWASKRNEQLYTMLFAQPKEWHSRIQSILFFFKYYFNRRYLYIHSCSSFKYERQKKCTIIRCV